MNEEKKLKREKKKDKKNKKSADIKNKAVKKLNMFVKSFPTLTELQHEIIPVERQVLETVKKSENYESSDENEANTPTDQSEVQMLDSLTGIPFPEDELLFAVPVVAPYNALTNYKYNYL